jgi:hypothetical protein
MDDMDRHVAQGLRQVILFKQSFVRKFALVAVLSLMIPQAVAQQGDKECTFETCKAGTSAVTYFKKSDPYYACPTRELATYVTTIVGLLAINATLVGEMPNVSDKTGEPEYTGETKTMVDGLREQAHVQTFDEAIKFCALGSDKRRVTVLNMPENSLVAYVLDEARKQTFWMSIANLDKVR